MVKTATPSSAVAVFMMYAVFLGTPLMSLTLCILVPLHLCLRFLLLLEVLHCVYYAFLKTYLNHIQDLQALVHPRCAYSYTTKSECWKDVVKYASSYGIKDWVTTWFGRRYAFDTIDSHSFMYWLRYAVFGHKGGPMITTDEERSLRPFLCLIEKTVGKDFKFPKPRDSAILKRSNTYGFEAIKSVYHPLWFYAITGALELYYQRVALMKLGFAPIDGLVHCLAHHQGCRIICKHVKGSRPIVFIHGVGAGLFPYNEIISCITLLNRTVVLPYIPHISMTHAYETPSNEAICDLIQLSLATVCAAGGRAKVLEVDVVANSFGTCVASTLVGRDREKSTGIRLLCRHLLLLDPVSVALSSPDLTSRFVYDRRYTTMIDFIVRSEIHIMYSIQRRFDWMESFISPVMAKIDRATSGDCGKRDMNNQRIGPRIKIKIYVASNDAMIDLPRLTRILETCFQPQAEVAIMEDISHGQWIGNEKYIQMVIKDLSN